MKVKFEDENGDSVYFTYGNNLYGIGLDDNIQDHEGCVYDQAWHKANWELVGALRQAKIDFWERAK